MTEHRDEAQEPEQGPVDREPVILPDIGVSNPIRS